MLFLDELPEFGPRVLEVMRQPIEDKIVTISRAQGSLTFPANFQLIAAMNPCPCGYYGDPVKTCTCSAGTVTKYQKRISGPLLDRIDIHIEVPRVEYEKLSDDRLGEPSAAIQARVEAARQRQRERFDVGAKHRPRGESAASGDCLAGTNASPVQSQRRHAPGGSAPVLRPGRYLPLADAHGDEPIAAIGAGLSPHPQAGADDCGFSGE